jgi:predicted nucleotidyltransferase
VPDDEEVLKMIQIAIPYEALQTLCEKYHVRKLSLFGSVLRADFRPDSDVDVLVEFEPEARIGYFELFDVQQDLAALLGRKVDLLTPGALSRYFRQRVLDTAEVVYERN